VTAGSRTQANLVPRTRATTRALAWPAVAARAWPTDVSVFVPILACSGARMGIEGVYYHDQGGYLWRREETAV